MTSTIPPFKAPCLESLVAYQPSKIKLQNRYDSLFDHDTLNRLKDSALTLKESATALHQNTLKKVAVGNATYLAHALIPAAASYSGAINTELLMSYTDFIKEHFPSFLQKWLPQELAIDQPCSIPTWMNAALVATGCYAFLSIANFNRKMMIRSYEKDDNSIGEAIDDTQLERSHQLKNMYDQAATNLDGYFANDAARDPELHEKLWSQAALASGKLPYLREALISKGLSSRESLQVLRKLSKVLRLIHINKVGLRNSKLHILYNTKFLANFGITGENCLPHLAQSILHRANQKKQTTSVAYRLLSALVGTTLLATPITFAATYLHPSAKTAIDAGKMVFDCAKNATSWDAASFQSTCLKDLPIQDIQWTTAAVVSTAFITYATLKMGKWAAGKIAKRNMPQTQEMNEAMKRTREVYDAIADYLSPPDGVEPEAVPPVRPSKSRRHEEKSEPDAPDAKIALAKSIQQKLPAIKGALGASGLGCNPSAITQKLETAIGLLLPAKPA